MNCYKSGGCGVYENRSCAECPASKPDYAYQRCGNTYFQQSYLWYKLCVWYYANTELYDRQLTNLRSPYDPTEAYLYKELKSFSRINAKATREFIDDIAEELNISYDIRSTGLHGDHHHYSAQRWIDEYYSLVDAGEMDFIKNTNTYISMFGR